jgi:hypothetical protein
MTLYELPVELVTADELVGRRVHHLMWMRSMTQTAFAEVTGCNQSTVAKRLKGKLGWKVEDLLQTARVLKTSVAYLVGETDLVDLETTTMRPRQDSNLRPRDYKGILSQLRQGIQ